MTRQLRQKDYTLRSAATWPIAGILGAVIRWLVDRRLRT